MHSGKDGRGIGLKNIFILFFTGQFRKLLLEPTNDTWIQIFRSVFVGGAAFLVDAGVLFFVEKTGVHYLVAAAIAFIFGLFANFVLSKKFVFAQSDINKKVDKVREFAIFAVVGIIGLLFTELLMYLCTDVIHLYFMLSKVIATIIVLFWNFGARKFLLYRS